MNRNYYLPINHSNLGQYFSRGIILPSSYATSWIRDIQSKYDNSILLCSKIFTNESKCSLTISFSNDEFKNIKQISESFYIYHKPLPIARVKNINFSNSEQSRTTVYNIEQTDAFIPKELIKILEYKNNANISELNIENVESNTNNWAEVLNIYNQVLGGFSIMRIADFQNIEYPKNYFNCFAFINKHVRDIVSKLEFEENYQSTINILEKDKSEKRKLPSVYHKVDIEKVKIFAKKYDNIELPIKRGLIRINEIKEDNISYILSILATYGEDAGKTKKSSDFISALISNSFSSKKKEQLCLVFGINQGYANFRNKYHIDGQIIKTKFELNSELDYIIIESIYQYVFNNITDNTTFSYINDWCPINKQSTNLQDYETYEIFDKEIIYKKKVLIGSEEYLQKLFELFTKNSIFKSLLEVVNKKVSVVFEETIKQIYTKIKNDVELLQKKKVDNYKKEIDKLTEEIKKLKYDNNQISVEVEEALSIYSDKRSVNEFKVDNNRDNNDILKAVIKDIQGISDLQTIARHIGIKSEEYKKYKRANIEDLRKIILDNENKISQGSLEL